MVKSNIKAPLCLLLVLSMLCACPFMAYAAEEETYAFTMFTNWGSLGPVGEMYMNNLEEELNLDITYEFPSGSGYNDALTTMMATLELPEVILMPTETSQLFRDACEDGLFIDLAPYLESGDYPNIMAHTADVSWESLDVFKDGRIWGIPRSSMMRADGYVFRKDWLDAVGITIEEGKPITLDQLYEILYAFTYNDPDQNGVNDTYGISSSNANFASFFSEAFGISRNLANTTVSAEGWGEYDGEYMTLKYSRTDDSYKEYLTFLQKLWKAGVYDPDTFNLDDSSAGQRFIDGVTGVEMNFPGNMARKITTLKSVNENADLIFIPAIVQNEGDPYTAITTGTGIWYVYVITSEAEHPERILELMDTALDDEHWSDLANRGVQGVTYDLDENGNVIDLSSQIPEEYKGNNGVMAIIRFMRRSDGIEFFLDVNLTPEDRVRYTDLINVTLNNFIPSLDGGYVPPSASATNFLDYMTEMNSKLAQIVSCQVEVSEWDNVLDGWYKAGGDQYVKEMQEYIASVAG